VLIDRRRLHRTARPRPTHGSLSKTNVSSPLTVEELALLPVAGVPAFRAVRTFTWPNPGSDAPAPRALILQAHDGVGAAAVQLLVERGAVVTAHVPKASTAVDARLRSWGVTHVVPGLPLVVLAEFRGAGATFDFILDTVGGKAIWNVARMLLSNTGGSAIFVTTVGDSPERPIPSSQDHFRAGMRSLGIGPGERPGGYAWVSAAADTDLEGEDVKDALAALLMPTTPRPGQSSSSLALKPWVPVREDERRARVLPFERAPDAFGKEAEGLRMGGTAVITIMD
jgi:NADPH:quinone reductase-like Zn-dependent oxidoreductase